MAKLLILKMWASTSIYIIDQVVIGLECSGVCTNNRFLESPGKVHHNTPAVDTAITIELEGNSVDIFRFIFLFTSQTHAYYNAVMYLSLTTKKIGIPK